MGSILKKPEFKKVSMKSKLFWQTAVVCVYRIYLFIYSIEHIYVYRGYLVSV